MYKKIYKKGELILVRDSVKYEYTTRVFKCYTSNYKKTGQVICFPDINNYDDPIDIGVSSLIWNYSKKADKFVMHKQFRKSNNEIDI